MPSVNLTLYGNAGAVEVALAGSSTDLDDLDAPGPSASGTTGHAAAVERLAAQPSQPDTEPEALDVVLSSTHLHDLGAPGPYASGTSSQTAAGQRSTAQPSQPAVEPEIMPDVMPGADSEVRSIHSRYGMNWCAGRDRNWIC